ncbi:hypothetical protein IU494_30380 [Nocardia terpenica]|uniref:hypothetical protein n=1 Tax=Nocardia terpenica TaxID=455432 RepID=UPI0018935CF7|nr:hypothetical protein [Nocardia terpenica]MBF6064956.1 hypothetical protein [Nocardia terpenica]MBF6115228.1 hypothetical protein [Nocardia terpenica]MBF6122550.1 hypothetical protein [Nocardia terpenica]
MADDYRRWSADDIIEDAIIEDEEPLAGLTDVIRTALRPTGGHCPRCGGGISFTCKRCGLEGIA